MQSSEIPLRIPRQSRPPQHQKQAPEVSVQVSTFKPGTSASADGPGAVDSLVPGQVPTAFEFAEPEALELEVSAATRKLRMLRTLVCGNKYERAARARGATVIAGVDEVGRGSLFGPVVAAAVVLPADCRIRGLRDSKQLLPPDRERLAKMVEKRAIAIAIEEISAEIIDRVNIYQATRIAMAGAVTRLSLAADHLLIDAMRLDLPCAQTSIIYGDSLSISIAAASVVAKVYRDRRMCELDREYPGYGLASHKGYSTPEHLAALLQLGPCPLHRRSFRPVMQSSLPWDALMLA